MSEFRRVGDAAIRRDAVLAVQWSAFQSQTAITLAGSPAKVYLDLPQSEVEAALGMRPE